MESNQVRLTCDGSIAILTFNRPNTMNTEDVAADLQVLAVIICGEVCALGTGGDLVALQQGATAAAATLIDSMNEGIKFQTSLDASVIASVQGVVAVANLSLAHWPAIWPSRPRKRVSSCLHQRRGLLRYFRLVAFAAHRGFEQGDEVRPTIGDLRCGRESAAWSGQSRCTSKQTRGRNLVAGAEAGCATHPSLWEDEKTATILRQLLSPCTIKIPSLSSGLPRPMTSCRKSSAQIASLAQRKTKHYTDISVRGNQSGKANLYPLATSTR